jgi:hypothetical protein
VRGSIRTKVRGKRYEIRVALGLDPKTGRYRQKSLTVRGSRAEAERALRHLVGCQNSITPLTLEFAGACRSSRCEF